MNKRKQQQQQQSDQLVVKKSRGHIKEADYYGDSYKVQERVAARATAKSKWTESLITQIREDGSFLLHIFGTSMSILILPNENTGRLMGKYSEFDVSFTQRRQVFLVPATRVFQIGQLWKLRGHRGDCEVVSKDNISVTFKHNDNLTTVLTGNDIFDGVTACVNSDMEDDDSEEEKKKVVYSLVSDSEEEKEKKKEKKDLCRCGKLASKCVCANLDCRKHLFADRHDSERIAAYMSDECLCYEGENVVKAEEDAIKMSLWSLLDEKYERRVTARIAVKDKDGDWYTGKVLEKISEEKGCKIHYMGFPKRHDEWIKNYWARVSPFFWHHFEPLPNGEKDDLQPIEEFREFYSNLKELRDWTKFIPEEEISDSEGEDEKENTEMKFGEEEIYKVDEIVQIYDADYYRWRKGKIQGFSKKPDKHAVVYMQGYIAAFSVRPKRAGQEDYIEGYLTMRKLEEEKTEMKFGEEVYKVGEEVECWDSKEWAKGKITCFQDNKYAVVNFGSEEKEFVAVPKGFDKPHSLTMRKLEENLSEMKLGSEVFKLDEEVDLKVSGVWRKAIIVGFERLLAIVKDLSTGLKYSAVPMNAVLYDPEALLMRKKEEKKEPECAYYCSQPGINYGCYNGMWRYACEEHDQRNNPKYTTRCNFELCASAKIIYDSAHRRFVCDNCQYHWSNICIDVCPHAAPAGTCNNKGVNANEKSYQIQASSSVEFKASVEKYKKLRDQRLENTDRENRMKDAEEEEKVAELVKPSEGKESKEEIVAHVQDNELSCKDCVHNYYVDAYPNEHQRWRLCQHCFVMSIEEGVQFCKLVYKESSSTNEMKQVFQTPNYRTKRNPEVGDIYSIRSNYRVAEVMHNHYLAVDLINGDKVMLRNGEFYSADFINTESKYVVQQTMNRTNLINLMLGTKQELFAVQWKKKNPDPNSVILEETRTIICSIPPRKGNTVDVFGHTLVHCWYDVTNEEFLEGNVNRFKTITNQTVQWMIYKGTKYIATN